MAENAPSCETDDRRGTYLSHLWQTLCGQLLSTVRTVVEDWAILVQEAFLLFIDVWGLGNRGMFRTIRDLLLRPDYMIRDYLRSMQMAYFPPFKMFFLITALSLVIDSGLNIRGMNRQEHREEETEELFGVESSSKDKGNSEEIEAKTKQAEVKDNKEHASEEKKDKVDREHMIYNGTALPFNELIKRMHELEERFH